jgi:TetR/AcrR family transcriptional regulator, cholesterol catabolism regulator
MDGITRSVLDRLAQVPARQLAVDREEHSLVTEARARGTSWSTIADCLGLGSRQAAVQRHQRLARRLRGQAELTGSGIWTSSEQSTPHPRIAGTPGSSRAAETRRRLIDAAAQVLAERGYASTRLSDIAARADLRAGSVYHHFPSKDALIEEVLVYGVVTAHRNVVVALDGLAPSASPAQRLGAAMTGHLHAMLSLDAVARAHAHAFEQLPAPMKDRIRPYRRAYGALWSEVIGSAVDAGTLRGDIHRYLLRLFVVNSVEAVSMWAWRTHRSAPELSAMIGRLILEGATAPTPGSPKLG